MSREKFTQSERKIALLDETIRMLQNMISACEEIKSGVPETTTLKKHNINLATFRNVVFNERLGFKNPVDLPLTEEELEDLRNDENAPLYPDMIGIQASFLSWEERLYLAIIGEKDLRCIPPDLDKTMESVMERCLTEREILILRYRFVGEMTLEEVGSMINRSGDRVRQIEAKAIRKLRYPTNLSILKYGPEYAAKLEEIRFASITKQTSDKVINLENELEDVISSNDITELTRMQTIINDIIEEYGQNNYASYDDMLVEEFFNNYTQSGLSVREFNCLRRAGIKTIADLKDKDYNSMVKIRNMGIKSLVHIIELCEEAKLKTKFVKEYRGGDSIKDKVKDNKSKSKK